jgi:hypothetical protein
VAKTGWWSVEVVGGRVDCFLRIMGGSINLLWGGAGAPVSDKLCSGASLVVSNVRALVRGEETGLSDAKYVVANMESLSSNCTRSIEDRKRLLLS